MLAPLTQPTSCSPTVRSTPSTIERNAVHHYQIVHPDDQQRVIDNHIPVNATPIFSTDWAGQDADYKRLLGEELLDTNVHATKVDGKFTCGDDL